MYSSSSSVLAVRAKGSLYHHQHQHQHHHHHRCRCFSGDRVAERCGCCSLGAAHPPCTAVIGFSNRGVLASPGLLYGYLLRQSALIRWAPSRIIVSRGSEAAAAARYSRLTAAWDGDPCAGGGWRRWRKCGNRRVSSRGAVFDEGFDDMLGLLVEAEERCGEDDDVSADDAAEGTYAKEKVGLESHGGLHRRFHDDKIESLEEEDRNSRSARRSASSFSSMSGDPRRNKDFRRRGRDESSGSYYRNDDIAAKEARELRKREEVSRSRRRYHASDSVADLNTDARKKEERAGVKDCNTASRTGSVLQSRERYVQKDQCFSGREESKEELPKASHVRQSSVTDRSVVDKKVVNVTKEETSATALLEVVRRQQDEMIQLRKDYQDLLRTTQVQNVSATKASASCSVINTRVENSVENSTLPMGLLEEVQRQRKEIEKLNENYQLLMRAYTMKETRKVNESNFAKSFGTMLENREEGSTSAVNLVEEGTVRLYNMDVQTTDDSRTTSSMLTRTNELEKQHHQLKRSDICESDIRTSTNYGKGLSTNLEDRKKKAASAVSSVEELQKHNTSIAQGLQNIGHTNLEATSHNLTAQVHIHNNSAESDSKSQRGYMTTIGDQQYGTNSAVKLIEEREEQVSSINEKVSGHTDSRRISEKQTNIVETHKIGATKTSRIQGHVNVNTMVKDQEESSTSHLLRSSRDKRVRIDQRVAEEINVSNDTQTHINLSVEFRSEADKANATSSDGGKNTVSASNLVSEEHLRNEDGRQPTQQLILRTDSHQSSPENFDGGPVNLSQASSSKMTENEDDYSSLVFVQEAKERQKASLFEETLGAFSGTSGSWHTSLSTQMHELDYHTESDRTQLVNADVLESARRLAKSSSLYIGEFVDQLQQKVSASEETDTTSYNSPETQMEVSQPSPSQKSKATTEHEDEAPKKEDTRQYSSRSEVAGPSDEIWDVRGASSQEPSSTGQPEKDSSGVKMPGTAGAPASASDGAIIKRSSKSLWSYIAEVVRMSWISRTSSEKSMLKTGTKSSSDESVKSDAWYSGHETEGDHEKNVKDGCILTKQSELNKAAVSKPHSRTSSISGQVRSEVTRQGEKRLQENIQMPNPPGFTGGSYESDGSPPAPSVENIVPFETSEKFKHIRSTVGAASIHSVKATTSTPAVETTGQSASLGTASSSTYEEETETDRLHVAKVGFIESQEQETETSGLSEVDGFEVKDVELKRRKLQRKKQVLREEFEEWEEAYKLESELRKNDEFFMREALLEAKKAAEMWEVPVGAVLVQDGKIIARGCNLVEDLRDSTAHAEMICIREASNLLRTWRLAGTTLYVTLEPCAMCAGAILQARIDVVVWGAPNKLLGADGSWVRLFPGGGDDGKQGLDQADEAVGPVHPFHPKITIRRGVLAMECADSMQQFFQRRRKKKKPEPSPPSCLPVSYPAKIMTKMHNIFSLMTCL